jgi:hypothetical protein
VTQHPPLARSQPGYQPGWSTAGPVSRRPVLLVVALIAALAAVIMSVIALASIPAAPTGPSAPSTNDIAAAKKAACGGWGAASSAMAAARQPFVDAQGDWSDPGVMSALVQSEAGVVVQVEYLRQHTPPATPPEVANPIADYIAAVLDTVAADGQHQPAAVANSAADRSSAAAAKIRAACGL